MSSWRRLAWNETYSYVRFWSWGDCHMLGPEEIGGENKNGGALR